MRCVHLLAEFRFAVPDAVFFGHSGGQKLPRPINRLAHDAAACRHFRALEVRFVLLTHLADFSRTKIADKRHITQCAGGQVVLRLCRRPFGVVPVLRIIRIVHACLRRIFKHRSHAVDVLGLLNLLVAGEHSVKYAADFIGQFYVQVFQGLIHLLQP